MYHSCRAAVFYTHRNDVDVHEKVASEIGKIVGEHIEESLDFWRAVRNEKSGDYRTRWILAFFEPGDARQVCNY